MAQNPRMLQTEKNILDLKVQAFLDKKAILPVSTHDVTGFISFVFVVPKKVVNLKPLNQFLAYEHFKMVGIHMLRDQLKIGDYLVKIDSKDAYMTVPIRKGDQKYLRFLRKKTMLEFAYFSFGLATAPWAFTKLMKLVVAMLR